MREIKVVKRREMYIILLKRVDFEEGDQRTEKARAWLWEEPMMGRFLDD